MNLDKRWPDGWRILCVRPDNLGDVLMTTPAFRALKELAPNGHLTLLTSSAGATVAPMIPELDDTLIVDLPWVSTCSQPDPAAVLALADRLRQGRFDAAVIFTVQSQNPLPSAMLCYLAGIPHVLSYCRENPYQLVSNWVPDPEVLVATRHEVTRQLDLVRTIGAEPQTDRLSLVVPAGARQQARQILSSAGIDSTQPWYLLHPGVSEEKRRYPAAAFASAARQLLDELGGQLILTGSASEQAYVETIRQQICSDNAFRPVYNLAGRFDLPTLAGLIADAPVLIANNTGPVHMAAALRTPVVVLYAKTNPQHTPWQVASRVLYFDVPVHLRSRNVLLQQFPDTDGPVASAGAIVQAVRELTRLDTRHDIHPFQLNQSLR
ncbi:lipopolysaccharide heptosyltransferase II [Spirosoma lacussanchae]|uniref:glycosyltransferase family 9 protein n=1 Tax=Spirosoma lacussanchae TaxID=1884249 RepID=UPI001109183C|nr:glycosyltransferase family 9 protein [Spirosoma lacussanchae]